MVGTAAMYINQNSLTVKKLIAVCVINGHFMSLAMPLGRRGQYVERILLRLSAHIP